MAADVVYRADWAMQHEIAAVQRRLSRGLWVLEACSQCAFFAVLLRVVIGTANMARAKPGCWQTTMLEANPEMFWIVPWLLLGILLNAAHQWLTYRHRGMIAACHLARAELLSYLARGRC